MLVQKIQNSRFVILSDEFITNGDCAPGFICVLSTKYKKRICGKKKVHPKNNYNILEGLNDGANSDESNHQQTSK